MKPSNTGGDWTALVRSELGVLDCVLGDGDSRILSTDEINRIINRAIAEYRKELAAKVRGMTAFHSVTQEQDGVEVEVDRVIYMSGVIALLNENDDAN